MRLLRFRPFAAALLVIVAVAAATTPLAPGSADASVTAQSEASLADHELLDALDAAGFSQMWLDKRIHTVAVSELRVDGSEAYDEARSALIADAQLLVANRGDEIALLADIDEVERTLGLLEELALALRAQHSARKPLDRPQAETLRKLLLQTRSNAEHAALRSALASLDGARSDLGAALLAAEKHGEPVEAGQRPIEALLAELDGLSLALGSLRTNALVTSDEDIAIGARIEAAIDEVTELRRTATTPVDNLPIVVLDAYVRAGAHDVSGCTVGWRLLAGIGRIESLHGTLGGASVATGGTVSPRILGPLLDGGATERDATEALAAQEAEAIRIAAEEAARIEAEEAARRAVLYPDPTPIPSPTPLFPEPTPTPEPTPEDAEEAEDYGNGFAVIEDTDGGSLDGNAAWDRAVGPMQFIPGTWRLWATDGNDDGVIDPHNYYDATASAAAYLCHLEARNGPSPWDYVLGYNSSSAYVADVVETATRLESVRLPGE